MLGAQVLGRGVRLFGNLPQAHSLDRRLRVLFHEFKESQANVGEWAHSTPWPTTCQHINFFHRMDSSFHGPTQILLTQRRKVNKVSSISLTYFADFASLREKVFRLEC